MITHVQFGSSLSVGSEHPREHTFAGFATVVGVMGIGTVTVATKTWRSTIAGKWSFVLCVCHLAL